MGLNRTLGASPAARACMACARPISPPSVVTAELLDMFCALNGATRMPLRANSRHRPATTIDFPASDVVPATSSAPLMNAPNVRPVRTSGRRCQAVDARSRSASRQRLMLFARVAHRGLMLFARVAHRGLMLFARVAHRGLMLFARVAHRGLMLFARLAHRGLM